MIRPINFPIGMSNEAQQVLERAKMNEKRNPARNKVSLGAFAAAHKDHSHRLMVQLAFDLQNDVDALSRYALDLEMDAG